MYKWSYSYEEITTLYKAKVKDFVTKKEADYKFIIDVVGAIFGDGKSEGDYGKDTGDGITDRTDEQDASMREMLGDDYNKVIMGT